MRNYILTAPRWQVAVTMGLFAGLFAALVAGFVLPFGWIVALGFGAGFGVLLGGSTAYNLESTRRLLHSSVTHLPPHTVAAAAPAAARGPVPVDPEIRATALQIAVHRLETQRRHRTFYILGMVICGFSTVLSISAGFDWLDVIILAGGLGMAYQLYGLRRLSQRVRLLSADGNGDGLGAPSR